MKKIKLFLAAMAAMVTMGVNAQSWVAPTITGEDPVSGGQYKIKNVGSGMFLDMGKAWFSWSTTAILSDNGINFTVNADGSNWKFIRTGTQGVFTSGNGITGDAMHVDNTANTYGITKLPNGNYHIHDANGNESSPCWGYGTPSGQTLAGVVAHADATAEGWNCEWQFISATNDLYNARVALYEELLKAYAEGADYSAASDVYENSSVASEVAAATAALHTTRYEHALDVASNDDPREITEWVLTNADFSAGNIDGWETNYVAGQQAQNIGYQGASYSNGTIVISKFIEAWKPGAALGDGYLRQTVQGLPEGKFVLEADAIATWQNDDSRQITGAQLYIYADGVTYKTDMSTKNGKPQNFSTEFMNTGAGDVIFGLRTVSANCNWLCADNFKVTFYGIDLSPYATLLAQAVAEAQAVEGTVPAAVYSVLAAVVTENNKEWETSQEYTTAIAAIQNATDNAKVIQTAYADYNAFKAIVEALDDDATIFQGDATVDVSAADAAVTSATTVAEIEAAKALLKTAALDFVTGVTVNEGKFFDMTNILVVNPTVSVNTDGWNKDNVVRANEYGTGPTTNYGETEFYQSTFDFNQSVTLPAGTWEFGVSGFHRAGTYQTYFYAGEDRILLHGESSDVVNSMADAKTYFDNGNGLVALKFLLENESNTIKIGILNEDTETDRWTIFRDFTLKYYGAPDYTVYEEQWAALVEEANTAKTTHVNVTGTELTALNAAIEDSPAGSNLKATYTAKINALQAAIQTFNAAAPSYDAYVAYKAETIALWGSDFNVAAPSNAAEAVTAVQNLNVAQYNKVASDYTFSATGLIGDFGSWTGTATVAGEAATPNYLSNEHWSGTTHAYYEQASTGWGANSWTIKYEKKCTLPAGNYVIKVAARSSVDVTSSVSCSATTTTISLPKEGARTRGINTSGVASWSDSDTFVFGNPDDVNDYTPAVGGRGAGWEWRFLPFELTTESEVTMTFYAETSKKYNWMSIADGELLSTTKLAEDVAYNEANDNTIENKIIADVTMSRTIKEGYNTVVLPFTLTANQVAAAFGAGTEVYAFSENSTDANNVTINFNKGDGSITANVPVLVKATSASNSQTFEGVQIVAADAAVVEGANFDFVGTYAPTSVAAGDYFIGNGALYKSEGATSMKAFRAYIQDKNPDQQGEVKLFIDDIETSISEINGIEAEQGIIYNIAGQRVNKAQKGIYIVNGKKVVVK